jgi:hypothetical protein
LPGAFRRSEIGAGEPPSASSAETGSADTVEDAGREE